jgi:hypothetical protein
MTNWEECERKWHFLPIFALKAKGNDKKVWSG